MPQFIFPHPRRPEVTVCVDAQVDGVRVVGTSDERPLAKDETEAVETCATLMLRVWLAWAEAREVSHV